MLSLKGPPPLPSTLEESHQLIRELWSLLQAQQKQMKQFARQLERLDELEAEVERLRSRAGRSSRNSSMPPSSDAPEHRSKRNRKPRSQRKKGAQPGHDKHERALLPEDQVDHCHVYLPSSQCDCGGSIATDDQPAWRHQVFDLPEVRYTVTEHQVFSGHCTTCGKKHTARWPDWVPGGQMGPGLISTIILLSGQFHLSIRQIQAFLTEQWGLSFSIGAISQAQGKANPWLGPVYRQIGEHARHSIVAHADETRHYRQTEQRWLWALVTRRLCYFMTHYSRGQNAADDLLGDFNGYLVTDHYSGYNRVPKERRQLCWAHLLRHFQRISERKGLAGEIGARLLLIGQCVFRTHHRFANQPRQQWRYRRRMRRLRQSFQATLQRGSQLTLSTRTANQCQHLFRDEAMCWTFLQHPDIPLTNNEAERAIRPYVIWRKLSFASQSHQGDQFRPMISSIIGTAQRLGISTAKLLRQICTEGLTEKQVTTRLPLDNALPQPA